MSTYATTSDPQFDRFGSGFAGAILLHAALVAAILAAAWVEQTHSGKWGENASTVGAIQASMVSAIPLPSKVPPVKDNVLTPETPTVAPAPQPKEAALPPPKPTDILIKSKTPPATKTAPVPTEANKHPQPTPDTPKATAGEAATQLPMSVTQLANGTASMTVQNRTFGVRYAYYLRLISSAVNQKFAQQIIDPRTSAGKSVTIVFDINSDGTVGNLNTEIRSGSTSLDTAATSAIRHIDSFGPLPPGAADHITIEYKFDYHQ